MATTPYNNDFEIAVSITHADTRIDFSLQKEERVLEIAVFTGEQSEPTKNINLPLLPGMAVLGSFFSNPEVMMAMVGELQTQNA